MIRCTRVSMQYPGRQQALKQVSLHVAHGEMAFVTGHSGAGKSTLLRLVALIERQSRGQIIINGQNLERIKGARIQLFRRQIGSIFQDHRLLHDRTVFDNVALPLTIVGYSPQEIGRRVRAALDKVALLHKARAYPITLSAGEQQRVGIARAVVNRPPLLLADEPTGNLDPDLSWEIMKLFTQFNQVGLTVLIATHDLSLIRRMNHRIITLREGRLVTDNREAVH
ncbi:MAG: cell division ATP-binding protein FtsE [Gammaproteobacteria bacterium]